VTFETVVKKKKRGKEEPGQDGYVRIGIRLKLEVGGKKDS